MGQLKALTPLPEIIQGLEANMPQTVRLGSIGSRGGSGLRAGVGRTLGVGGAEPWAFLAELKEQVPEPCGQHSLSHEPSGYRG